MIRLAFLLGFLLFPAASLVVLFGTLRGAPPGRASRFYGALAILGLGVAAIAAAGEASGARWRILAALAVLLLGPSTGLFVALRTEGVRADPRLGWVLGPLGYLAGCALGIQVLARLGFGV